MDETTSSPIANKLKTAGEFLPAAIGILATYSLFISGIYLESYWGASDINFLDYISASDITRYGAVSLITILTLCTAISTLEYYFPTQREESLSNLDAIIISALFVLIGFISYLIIEKLFKAGPKYTGFVTLSIFVRLSTKLSDLAILKEKIHNRLHRITIVAFLLLAPALALLFGKMASNFNQSNTINVSYYEKEFPQTITASNLGKLGDFLFFYDRNKNSVIAINATKISLVRFNPLKDK